MKSLYKVAVYRNGEGSHQALYVSDSASGLALVSGLSGRFISVLAWFCGRGFPSCPKGHPCTGLSATVGGWHCTIRKGSGRVLLST